MIPSIFPNSAKPVTKETDNSTYTWYSGGYQTLGEGNLADAVECFVEEERNGAFTLTARVPATSDYADKLSIGSLIVADASPAQPRQAFEISKVTKSLNNMITVNAEHISYRLLYSVLRPFPEGGVQGLNYVFERLRTNKSGSYYIEGNDFYFTHTGGFQPYYCKLENVATVKSVLLGTTGSVLDVFGGCYQWDNFTVTLHAERGHDNGVKILYGKNLLDSSAEYNNTTEATASGVVPIFKKDKTIVTGNVITLSEDIRRLYCYGRTIVKDFSSDIETDDSTPVSEIESELNTRAASWARTGLRGVPDVNLKTSFIPLHQTVEYADLANIESVEIDDTVHVYVPTLDIDVKAKVIKTKYNVLLDRYDNVEVGNFRTSINQAIRSVKGA